ncbi:DUF4239 domain-containing protein [Psychrosphaera haliotis]|uniref:DUF4239 domain-containing protein n=1 Tax=Psychrosphaera haliotis TaxID=555083 RepID=A0A6N8FA38_9GAMM|nr:DUF4239 domain-containing protein [Psychrosphaera haliotis]MUH73313.1 DUF4239 domain-containing protein [Psychrosphaera haliotis]
MPELSWLYQFSSVTIAVCLFINIILFNEFGFRIGRFVQKQTPEEVKSLTGSIQASILGLLALLLGFTFSMSMDRYKTRSIAVIEEANVIQSTIIESKFLPVTEAYRANKLLTEYVEIKSELSETSIVDESHRTQLHLESVRVQKQLLEVSESSDFRSKIIKVIEQQNTRNALIKMHVPDVVLILLFVVFLSAVTILGYSVGLSGSRMMMQISMVSLLITLIVFIIIDLDRPKRGLIKIDQSPLLYLQQQPY